MDRALPFGNGRFPGLALFRLIKKVVPQPKGDHRHSSTGM